MKKPMLWLTAVLASVCLIAPISAQEKVSPVPGKSVEVKKPSFTFYYFDG